MKVFFFFFLIQFNVPFKIISMCGSRNFHERGSNENGNFWSQTRGGPTPKKSRNYLFLGKIFKFQGGSGPPVPPSGSAHDFSSYETEIIGGAKTGEPREKPSGTPASRTWLVSHVARAGLEPTPDTAVK